MVDSELIDQLDPDTRIAVRHALMTLASSGILLAQKEQLFRRVAHGADTELESEVAVSVLNYRKSAQALEALHQLGEYLYQEETES